MKIHQICPIQTNVINKNNYKGQNSSYKNFNDAVIQKNLSGLAAMNSPFISMRGAAPKQNDSWKKFVDNLDSYIKPENYLGGGGEADVYKINDDYVLRLLGGKKEVGQRKFQPTEDIFEGRNFGQSVAKSEDHYISINKFVPGKIMYKCNNWDPDEYLKRLEQYASLPDETLEQFINDVAFINSKGYRIDETNPENFLYDSKTGKIGIIDICRKGSSSLDLYDPYGHDWIVSVLCNGHDYLECSGKMNHDQKSKMLKLIKKVEKRVLPICEKYEIPINKYNEKNYCDFSIMELLDSMDKIDPYLEEGILHQLVRLNHPDFIPYLANFDINE